MMTAVIDALQYALADTYALYLKTQNYHWNVTGMNFIALHKMFEEQYKDLAEAVDEIAERLRGLGPKVRGNFKQFMMDTTLEDGNETIDALSMIQQLYEDHKAIQKTLSKVVEVACSNNDTTTEDMMRDRIRAHEKTAWMLRATMGI